MKLEPDAGSLVVRFYYQNERSAAADPTTVPELDHPDEPAPPPPEETGTADPDGRNGRCGARTRNECPPDQFCAFTTRVCDWADATGFCQDYPTSCTLSAPKVCACGGETVYPDVCAAKAAGERKIVITGCP